MDLRSFSISRYRCLSLAALLILPAGAALADTGEMHGISLETPAMLPAAVSVNLLLPEADLQNMLKSTLTSDISPNQQVLASSQFGEAADQTSLENQRGGSDVPTTPLSSVLSSGTVGNNRAVDVVTGSNAIREGSFANASGIPIVIQNTGANVLIQNSTIVNLQLR